MQEGKKIPQTVFVVHLQFILVRVRDLVHHEPNTLHNEHYGTDASQRQEWWRDID